MKRLAISILAAASTLAAIPAAAQAAPWVSINHRQANLDRRIDQGVRSGELTRREAVRLRGEFARLDRLEHYYRRTGRGLDMRERADLDQRFDLLSRQIRHQKHDRQDRY